MFKKLFVLFVLAIVTTAANAAQKDIKQYWKETGLEFTSLESIVNREDCLESGDMFLGCVAAINTVLSQNEPALALLTLAEVDKRSEFINRVVKTYGDLNIVEYKSKLEQKPSKPAEPVDYKAEAIARRNNLLSVYAKTGNQVPFEELLDFARKSVITPDNEAYITAGAITQLLIEAVDAHAHLDPLQYFIDQSKGDATEAFFGIGALMKQKDGQIVAEPIDGSPAHKAGMKAKDIVTAVDGVSVQGMPLDKIVGKIRGPEGTKVRITVSRKGETLDFVITRAPFKNEAVEAKLITDGGDKFAYIKLRDFMEDAGCDKIKNALAGLMAQGATSIIFDLRNNGGGKLDQAQCIANVFLPMNKVVVTQRDIKDSSIIQQAYLTNGQPTDVKHQMVTLINSNSASASEIVAGALQDHARSFMVGDRSFGKGSVQAPIYFGSNSKILFFRTISRFYLPSGRTNQVVGVLPDIQAYTVPNPTKDDMWAVREEDEFPNALPPVGSAWTQPRPQLMSAIQTCIGDKPAKVFAEREQDAIAPDYQLLVAEETLRCSAAVQGSSTPLADVAPASLPSKRRGH